MARRRRIRHRGRGLFSIGAKVLGRVFKIATKTGAKIAKKASQQAAKKARDINTWRKLTKKGIKSVVGTGQQNYSTDRLTRKTRITLFSTNSKSWCSELAEDGNELRDEGK